jgi:hypothetical protein
MIRDEDPAPLSEKRLHELKQDESFQQNIFDMNLECETFSFLYETCSKRVEKTSSEFLSQSLSHLA